MKKNHVRVPQCSTCGGPITRVVWAGGQCVGCAIDDLRLSECVSTESVVLAPEGSYPPAVVERMTEILVKHGRWTREEIAEARATGGGPITPERLAEFAGQVNALPRPFQADPLRWTEQQRADIAESLDADR